MDVAWPEGAAREREREGDGAACRLRTLRTLPYLPRADAPWRPVRV
ncbi:hypothetical protein J2X68_000467 [Streptomyces sp. 3330]|nr:hypothetical protein [Streptomyces sp. 3330]